MTLLLFQGKEFPMPTKTTHAAQEPQAASSVPSQLPPMKMTTAADDRPRELTAAEATLSSRAANSDAMPTLEPPQTNGARADGVGAWVSGKTVNALWGINQNRNTWVSIAGVGWKRLGTASDSGIMALAMLMAHAKQNQVTINYREEADGLIHEVYVW